MRLQHLHDGVGNLVGEPLLNLQPTGEHLHDPGELGETDDLAVGDIGDVGAPEERQQVVLTQRVQLDVPHQDHAVVLLLEQGIAHRVHDRKAITAGEPAQRLLKPLRRLEQALAVGVLTDRGQNVPHFRLERRAP